LHKRDVGFVDHFEVELGVITEDVALPLQAPQACLTGGLGQPDLFGQNSQSCPTVGSHYLKDLPINSIDATHSELFPESTDSSETFHRISCFLTPLLPFHMIYRIVSDAAYIRWLH
jgi:hypothetical protein